MKKRFTSGTQGSWGEYPLAPEKFRFVDSLMAFTAFDENGIVGFFTLRNPREVADELRIGFVIVDPIQRGIGKGKEMLKLGLRYAFDVYGAKKVSLGVFENNESAYHCYKAAGFKDVILDEIETYEVLGEEWKCVEMAIER